MRKKNIMMPAVVLVLIILILTGKTSDASAADEDNTICKGVFIDQVDVGGMTANEAQSALDRFIEELGTKEVIVRIDGHDVKKSLGKLGFACAASDHINQALLIGKSGNLIKRYKQLKDIAQDKFVYPLQFKIDDSKLNAFIDKDVSKYNVKPKNASVSRENGQFVYTDEKAGSMADVKRTAELITRQISNHWDRKDITVDAVMQEEKPKFTREDVEKCDTLMGSFSTTYESSSQERAKNLANGARLINNSVVYPKEVFSAHDTLAPFTVENGYEVAGAYLNGVVVDSVGGGACQVSTTLYNAVLFAELEVVQRSPHSMTVGYVDRSRDAALAGDYKDFKFMNSTDAPILIEGFTQGRTITFKVYGHETRDTKNRRIEFESEDTGHTPPPQKPIIKKDSTKPEGYSKVEQSAHEGYSSELYKVVYKNGTQVSRTRVNKSTYKAEAEHITIGTMKNPVPEKKEEKDKKEQEKKDQNKQADEASDHKPTESFLDDTAE